MLGLEGFFRAADGYDGRLVLGSEGSPPAVSVIRPPKISKAAKLASKFPGEKSRRDREVKFENHTIKKELNRTLEYTYGGVFSRIIWRKANFREGWFNDDKPLTGREVRDISLAMADMCGELISQRVITQYLRRPDDSKVYYGEVETLLRMQKNEPDIKSEFDKEIFSLSNEPFAPLPNWYYGDSRVYSKFRDEACGHERYKSGLIEGDMQGIARRAVIKYRNNLSEVSKLFLVMGAFWRFTGTACSDVSYYIARFIRAIPPQKGLIRIPPVPK